MANPSLNSIDYYRGRELRELNLADSAASPSVRNIHLQMADSYRKMVLELESDRGFQVRAPSDGLPSTL